MQDLYGERIEQIILFGSRATGQAGPDSDYDVAIFLHDISDMEEEWSRLSTLRAEILDKTGAFFEALPFPAGALERRTLLMHEIRNFGRKL